MKKVLLAILSLLYIIASLGFTLQKQYCTGMLANRGLNHCTSKICNKCGSEKINRKNNLCCRNENRFIKNDKDQNIPESVFQLPHLTAVAIPASIVEISCNTFASEKEANPISHAPPPGSSVAIYLLDRVFRI